MTSALRLISQRYIRSGLLRNYLSTTSKLCKEERLQDDENASSGYSSSSDSEEENPGELKQQLLNASIEFVPQYGWSTEALAAGARSLGLSSAASGICPDGGVEIAHYYYRQCNSELVKHLQTMVTITDGKVTRSLPMNQFMENALETRLRMIIPHIQNWPQAMALMSTPFQAPTAIGNLQTLVDDIWYYAGDTSTDINWYTKRIILAGVYKLTELCLIQDTSEDYKDTWGFLRRRLEDTGKIQQLKQSNAVEFAAAVTDTVQSMLGLRTVK